MGNSAAVKKVAPETAAPGDDGRAVLITGGASGIGLATAKKMALAGMEVYVGCRTREQAQQVANMIQKETGSNRVYGCELDLSSASSIRHFAKQWALRGSALQLLILAAAVRTPEPALTKDGFEEQFGVNHVGHFLLTKLMQPYLRSVAASPRVVVVTCQCHAKCRKMDVRNLPPDADRCSSSETFLLSKLANVLFAHELHLRVGWQGIEVCAVDPGSTDTAMLNSCRKHKMSAWLKRPQSPQQAADCILWAALTPLPDLREMTYFVGTMPARASPLACDPNLAHRLWHATDRMVTFPPVSPADDPRADARRLAPNVFVRPTL